MLDFFRDLYLETHGIDSEKAETERKAKAQKKRMGYILFSGRTKAMLLIMGVIFLVLQAVQARATLERGIGFLIADVSLCFMVIAAGILLLINRKKAQIAAAVLIAVFAVCEYLYMLSFFLLN